MEKVRFGVVGLGNMGTSHATALAGGASAAPGTTAVSQRDEKDKDFCLGAVCDMVKDKAKASGEKHGVPYFTSAEKMFDSGLIDAIIIATPHYWHPVLAIQAARRKLAVLCEKPVAVTVGEARAMAAECRKQNVSFGVMLQQRTRGCMMKMKEMVESGAVGEVFRVSMVCSSWFRTQAYYDSGSWRGTWDGEGGGVLINQAPHSLDLFQWIGGMPQSVIATVDTRGHKIEVEDTANVICKYAGGKIGYIYATTAELPGMEQLMVCGNKGTLIAENEKLRFGRLAQPLAEFTMTTPKAWDGIPCNWEDVTWAVEPDGAHINVIRAFAANVLRGEKLIATGEEAANELELSNATYIAGYKKKEVTLPVDAAEMDRLIAKLEGERSSGKGGGLRRKAGRQLKKLLAAQ